jgi:hypothetical protein
VVENHRAKGVAEDLSEDLTLNPSALEMSEKCPFPGYNLRDELQGLPH